MTELRDTSAPRFLLIRGGKGKGTVKGAKPPAPALDGPPAPVQPRPILKPIKRVI